MRWGLLEFLNTLVSIVASASETSLTILVLTEDGEVGFGSLDFFAGAGGGFGTLNACERSSGLWEVARCRVLLGMSEMIGGASGLSRS